MRSEKENQSQLTFSRSIYSLIDNAPIGMLLINAQAEVVYANEVMETYFEYFSESESRQFGNLFNCQIVSNDEDTCGTKRQCANCKIRNSIKNAMQHNRSIKDIKVHKAFVKNEITYNKWLDLAIVPIEIEDTFNLIVYVNDITESTKYQINLEMDELMFYEDINKDSMKFHENVLKEIHENCISDGVAYLILIELDNYQAIKDTFGAIWANDYYMDFNNYIYDLKESKDYTCRYSEHQVLAFIPHTKIDIRHYQEQLAAYKYKHFTMKASIRIKTLRVMTKQHTCEQPTDEKEININYFNSLSRLEKALDKEVIEWEI